MEFYVVGTLATIGYLLTKENKSKKNINDTNNLKIQKNEIPSVTNSYQSTYSIDVDDKIKRKQRKYNKLSNNYKKTGIIPNNIKQLNNKVKSNLAGVEIPIDDFKHNNMVPYFGGKIKQNIDPNINNSVLERYTGISDLQKSKTEVEPFTDVHSENIYGMNSTTDFEQDRMVNSRIINNTLPFKQQKVGPGLNMGYTDTPTGGFQQDTREYEYTPNVDDLRVKTNPKVTYEGRVVAGNKNLQRGKTGEVVKNRVDTYYELDSDRYFTTTGSVIKDSGRPCQIIKDTVRKDTNIEYQGIAYDNIGNEGRPEVQCTTRQQLEGFGNDRNEDKTYVGNKSDDYGKANILVYTNERDLTTTKTYEGNLTTFVKSIVAPLQDAMRFTNKEYTVQAKRPYGNLQKQFPDKLTIYDPNDIARTTIKETGIHDTVTANMTGEWNKGVVYDPEEIAKTTIRETLPDDDYHINIDTKVYKQTVYDPNDPAKTTVKETTEDKTRTGHIHRTTLQEGGGYNVEQFDMKNTNKQFTSQKDYVGGINYSRGDGDGYQVEDYDMKNTNKQFTSDNDYTGAGNSKDKKDMSRQDIMNALINDVREGLLNERNPTTQGSKVATSGSMINIQPNKLQKSIVNENIYGNANLQSMQSYAPNNGEKNDIEFTKYRQIYSQYENDRLDSDLLNAYKQNPYTQSITSAPSLFQNK